MRYLPLTIFCILSHLSHGQYVEVWRIGNSGDGSSAFSRENGTVDIPSANSALQVDDHYYFTGTYPTVGSVEEQEPLNTFERALTLNDPRSVIHFSLDHSTLLPGAEYQLELDFEWGNSNNGADTWEHIIQVSVNNTIIGTTPAFDQSAYFLVTVPAHLLTNGANKLLLERVGDAQDAYTTFDTISLSRSANTITDTDGDGDSDSWEALAGTDSANPSEMAPPLNSLIGINFISNRQADEGTWLHGEINGFIPQLNWNQMGPLYQWHRNGRSVQTAGTADIMGPLFGRIVDASGAAITGLNISTRQSRVPSNPNNAGTAPTRLLNGFLDSDNDYPAEIDLSGIPYANYDVLVYVASDFTGPQLRLVANENSVTEQICSPLSTLPQTTFLHVKRTANEIPKFTNVIQFENLSGSTFTLDAFRHNNQTAGIAAIQIIDTTADRDGDLIPDWYELQHELAFADSSDANLDLDGDSLTNLQEFQGLTDPQNRDSDSDGLSDRVETNTGTYLNTNNTGTDPNWADSDGDGLSDADEINALFFSNPVLSDSDNDGTNDKEELDKGVNPNAPSIPPFSNPSIVANTSYTWEFNNIQIIRDHGKIAPRGWRGDSLFYVECDNDGEPGVDTWAAMQLFLNYNNEGQLGFGFFSNQQNAFYRDGESNDMRYQFSERDLAPELGLSGSGTHDISDPFSVRFIAEAGATGFGDWTITYSATNLRTGLELFSHTESDIHAVSSIRNNTPTWREYPQTDDTYYLYLRNGVSLYQSDSDIINLPVFSEFRDSDLDGMPDLWETNYSLNPGDETDARLDPDGDLINNLDEYLIGTNPNQEDSDGDLFSDRLELQYFTNPTDSAVSPLLISDQHNTEDIDGSGYSDAWEQFYNSSHLLPDEDADGDGRTNLEESNDGTNPFDGTEFKSIAIRKLPTGSYEVRWDTPTPNIHTHLQVSENLETWNADSTSPTQEGDDLCIQFTPDDGKLFYQTVSTKPDSDGDNVSDYAEGIFQSNTATPNSLGRPVLVDQDGDGVPDMESSGDLGMLYRLNANQSTLTRTGELSAGQPTHEQAARFLKHSTFGPTISDIHELRSLGFEGWIERQLALDPTYLSTFTNKIFEDFYGPRVKLGSYSYNENDNFVNTHNIMTGFARAAIHSEDQLRQRIAYSLSQLLVVSRQNDELSGRFRGLSDYYDIFVRHAFGNYKDLLREVTYHPCMGTYLTSVGNEPPQPEINQYPDENYTRELMQLFTCGLWMLHPNGEQQLDSQGNAIPTYTNDEITEGARVFTGLGYAGNFWGAGGWQDDHYRSPMTVFADHHDFNEKVVLNGVRIPAREPSEANARQDIEDMLTAVFEHPSTAPFISRALIQFLVTDNPSPNYIERVSAVFSDNGSGVRGDLEAVIKAILLAPEANPPLVSPTASTHGKLREPILRYFHAARLLKFDTYEDLQWWDWGEFYDLSFQSPLDAPSVFNFYKPDYSALKELRDNQLVGPVFQITNSYTAVSFPNHLWDLIENGLNLYEYYSFDGDYRDFLGLASDAALLTDYVNLLCCDGRMSATTRQITLNSLNQTEPTDLIGKVKLALYIGLMCPEGAVQK